MKILIIGGNRFFGKKLARKLAKEHELYLINRGNLDDELGEDVQRIVCDRSDEAAFLEVFQEHQYWDVVFDHCCYSAEDARRICHALNEKVGKYIFISSQSVYTAGRDISEADFCSRNYQFSKNVTTHEDYAEAKRQAEAILFQKATFPVIAVRLPIVMGEDDYTKRLLFHIEHVKQQRPLFFPNLKFEISFIHSEDVAEALRELIGLNFIGPLNIAAPKPIALEQLMNLIELQVNKKTIYSDVGAKVSSSPYGISADWFMSTKKLTELGISVREISNWLPQLINKLSY